MHKALRDVVDPQEGRARRQRAAVRGIVRTVSVHHWDPRCRRPDVVVPVPVDPTGIAGPTPKQARGRRWRRSTRGLFVPSDVEVTVEQRIVEQAMRLPAAGAVTGWASLRWRGAAYFDGVAWATGDDLPVPLVLGGAGANLRVQRGSTVTKEQLPPGELEVIAGVRCTSVERAIFDEVRRVGVEREGAVVIDMAVAAGLSTVARFTDYLETRYAWTGVPRARKAAALASDDSRSPQESRMRLVWVLDAGLPPPLCNKPLFNDQGQLLGYPDLLDPVAGVVGEYDGADHLERDRRRADIVREQVLRNHGLEYFTVVRGDLGNRPLVARRMLETRARARFLPPEARAWTLEPPAWWRDRAS